MSNRVSTTAPAKGVIRHSDLSVDFRQKFVQAVRRLEAAKTGRYAGSKGIHSVFSGLNAELRRVGLDPVETAKELVRLGVIDSHPTKGGAMIYVKGEMPQRSATNGAAFGLLS